MRGYRFLTTWLVRAPVVEAFRVIRDVPAYPEWWPGVLEVEELEHGDAQSVGAVHRQVWRSRLPYRLEFTTRSLRVHEPHLIEAEATGELAGHGRWRLFEADGTTAVLYEWNVVTARAWMNALAPAARPAFTWNHHHVMRQGGRGLARRLGAELVAAS